ncbi:MAG: hypothetical protein JO144_16280 [Actinobacteria bacterium]|nr:hypothetical protein [Actinomycetota bacterium]
MARGSVSRSGYRKVPVAVLPVLALLVAGCGVGRGRLSELVTPGGDPAAALARWQSFPAGADPRPLVLVSSGVSGPSSGFATGTGQAPLVASALDLAVPLPAAPATAGGYPVVPAERAVARLRAAVPLDASTNTPLRIVSAALAQADFGTDRGRRRLPAWRFGLDLVREPVWVLAVDAPVLWSHRPDRAYDPGFPATVLPDGRTVSYDFLGAPDDSGSCGVRYSAGATESPSAVVIEVRGVDQGEPLPPGAVSAACPPGVRRTVTVRLAAPLGGRVLLTADGAPVMVTAAN